MVRPEACDWAARLDERGYHQVAISRPDTTWRWEGPTETAEDGFIDGATAGRWLAGWRRAAALGPGRRSGRMARGDLMP